MTDKSYEAIVSALDRLARGQAKTTNGKVTAVNLAAEAGVSKATLYRYFDEHQNLRSDYIAVRRRGIRAADDAPGTLHEALASAKIEIRELRRLLSESEEARKSMAQQLLLLWTDNKALRGKLEQFAASSLHGNNVAPFPSRKR